VTLKTGRNINSNDVASVTSIPINSVTPTTIAVANGDRISFSVCLEPGNVDVDVAIRYYPAAQDSNFMGDVLTRFTQGNNNLFNPVHRMDVDNPYYGEVSAISENGTHNIYITEY
jgi:hypothetical protein